VACEEPLAGGLLRSGVGAATFPNMMLLRGAPFLVAGIMLSACKTAGTSAAAPGPAASVSASGLPARPNPQAAAGITPQMIARGDTVFHTSSCTECHGQRAKGTPHGPDLTSGRFAQTNGSYAEIVKVITTGVPVDSIADPSFPEPMPARGGTPALSDDQIRSLAAYIYSLSHR
jgi:cytochrome c5